MSGPDDLAALHGPALTAAGLFDAYGRTMLRAQEMEEAVKVLHGFVAKDAKLNDLDFEAAIEKWVSRSAGALIDGLKLEPGLEEEVRGSFTARNWLAHRFFPETLIGMSLGEVDAVERATLLQDLAARFRQATVELQAMIDQHDDGLDEETEAEIMRILDDHVDAARARREADPEADHDPQRAK